MTGAGPVFVGAARTALRLGTRLVPRGSSGVTVLAYHLVGAGTDSPVDLPAETFRRQMEELRESGAETVPLSRAVAALEAGVPLERDLVAITFDDAYRNFDERARPVLEALDLPSTLFVPTDFVDGARPGPLRGAENLPPVPWGRLRELAARELVELGSHSRSHPDLRAVPDGALEDEVAGSKGVIQERTGAEPSVFCYPRALRSPRVEAAVARSYRGAVVGGGRKSRPGRTSPLRIQRVSVRRDMPVRLGPVLGVAMVLEEWAAERLRRQRPPERIAEDTIQNHAR